MTSAHRIPGLAPRATAGHLLFRRHGAALVLACFLAGGLAACSPPDWGDGDEDDPRIQSTPAADESYPNLSRVPNEAPRPTPKNLREDLVDGLIADRANARYSDEALTVETTAVPPAPPPPEGQPRVDITWETDRYLTAEEKAEIAAAEAAAAEVAEAEAEAAAVAEAAAEAAALEAAAESPDSIVVDWEGDRVETATGTPDAAPRDPVEPASLDAEPDLAATATAVSESPEEVEVVFETARVETATSAEEIIVEETVVGESVAGETVAEETVTEETVTAAAADGPPASDEAFVRTAIVGQLLATIGFAPGSSELNEGSEAILNEVLALPREPDQRLELVGYADRPAKTDDPVEQRMADLSLSLDRASAVAAALADLGAGKDSVIVRAATSTGTWWFRTEVQMVEIFLEK